MFKKKDPYSFTKFCTLQNGSATIGNVICEYQVTSYEDVQLADASSVNKPGNKKFYLHCTQRVNIYNPSGMVLSPSTNLTSYDDYPVMINTAVSIDAATGLDFQLLDYSPKTVNTKVQQSGTSGESHGASSTSTSTSTVGSSTSQTNTFGASASLSIGDISGLSESYDFSSSTTVTNEQSSTMGRDLSNNSGSDTSNAASMSIKDWGAYSLVNPDNKNPSWTFGQEYPWDAIECRRTNGATNPNNPGQVKLALPSTMSFRLFDSSCLYPPSQLSMFGINFVMKALWLVTIDNDNPQPLTIDHVINYFSGSHVQTGSGTSLGVDVYMDHEPSTLSVPDGQSLTTTIDPDLLSLDPLGLRNKAAIIGFIPRKFIVLPAPATQSDPPVPFRIISGSNSLLIVDSTAYPANCDAGVGFTPSETFLTAGFGPNCTELDLTLYFKVLDTLNDYTLFIKHWKSGTVGVTLTIVINQDVDNAITKYVDALEAEGGENNLLSIALRNQDYASVDYHDYLQLGLNSIQISLQPIGGKFDDQCGYRIRAVSIEKA